MDFEFWDNCWQRDSQPFHVPKPHPLLEKHLQRIAKDEKLLLPLSGKTLDPLYLAKQGVYSSSIEFNPKAVTAFIDENHLKPRVDETNDKKFYQFNGFELWEADFFKLTAEQTGTFSQVFDRAALVALPSELRCEYAKHLQSLLTENAVIYLVTMDYNSEEMSGPPFLITKDELQGYFPSSVIKELDREPLIDNHPRWKELNLSFLDEVLYQISL